MSDRRMVLSTALLQEQVIACCCGVLPGFAADLAIENALWLERGTVICSLTVINRGPARADNVVVTATLDGVRIGFLTRFAPDQAWTQRDPGRPLVATLGRVEPQEAVVLRFAAFPHATGLLTVKAAVTSSTVDLDPQNNVATLSMSLSELMLRTDLEALAEARHIGPRRQELLVTARNNGPVSVFGATLELTIAPVPPPGTSPRFFVTGQSPGWSTPQPTGQRVSHSMKASLGVLEAGASEVFVVAFRWASGEGVLPARARIKPPPGMTDPAPDNDVGLAVLDLTIFDPDDR